jgi:hypothetical protein
MKFKLLDFATIFREPSETSEALDDLDPEDTVRSWGRQTGAEVDAPEEVDGLVFVSRRDVRGWVPVHLLGAFERPKIEAADFVVACMEAEADLNGLDETAPWFAAADFIIARALFETELSNTVAHASGQDRAGPLLVSRDEWARFLKECPLGSEFTTTGWNDPIDQIRAAAYRMRCDAEAISRIKRGAGIGTDDEPFLPTLLDLFHAYLTNSPKAAVAIMDARADADQAGQAGEDEAKRPIAEVLDRVLAKAEVDELLASMEALATTRLKPVRFGTRLKPVALSVAVAATQDALAARIEQASGLIQTHAPDAAPAAGPSPREDEAASHAAQPGGAPGMAPGPAPVQPPPGPQPGGAASAGQAPGPTQPAGGQAAAAPLAAGPAGGPLGHLIAAHESGKAGYNAFNRGRAEPTPAKVDFSQMTLRQVMEKQALPPRHPDRCFAVGKYQIIPTTMVEAVRALRLGGDQKFTPALQERLFRNYLIGRKRPKVRDYVAGTGGGADLRAAQLALAQEFASIASPFTNRSFFAGSGGNAASISTADVTGAIAAEREAYRALVRSGKKPDDAWDALSGPLGGSIAAAPAATTAPKPPLAAGHPAAGAGSGLDIDKAVHHLRDKAESHSTSRCAKYVRLALAAGGIDVEPHPGVAKEYGSVLRKFKFTEVPQQHYDPEPGDIVVIQPCDGGNSAGHIQMYSGAEWISDFRQRDEWPGPRYRTQKPPRAIFRP